MEYLDLWIFNCGHCGGRYEINKIQVYGWPEDRPTITICPSCYTQLKGGIS